MLRAFVDRPVIFPNDEVPNVADGLLKFAWFSRLKVSNLN
jgi:hypothetical protein